MDALIDKLTDIASLNPFSAATWFVILTLGFFVWLFSKASRDKTSPVKWEHLIIDSQNDRASPYKVGYLVGVIVATWIVIRISDAATLSLDIFGAYLAFLLGGASVNSFSKKNTPTPPPAEDAEK